LELSAAKTKDRKLVEISNARSLDTSGIETTGLRGTMISFSKFDNRDILKI